MSTGEELKKEDEKAKELIESIIFKIGEKPRTERNTVYVLLPSTQELFQRAVELAARRMACETVNDEIKSIYKGVMKAFSEP